MPQKYKEKRHGGANLDDDSGCVLFTYKLVPKPRIRAGAATLSDQTAGLRRHHELVAVLGDAKGEAADSPIGTVSMQ